MVWKSADSTKVLSILSNLTTAMDAVGKAKRDLELELKIQVNWPDGLVAQISNMINQLGYVLNYDSQLETDVIQLIRQYEQISE
jgi:hypothetical protein